MKLPAPLRILVADLIERRLWPVAIALVVALVAVPVVLVGGAKEDTSVAALPATGGQGEADAVKLASEVLDGRTDRGSMRDPFTQPKVAKAPASAGSTTATAAAGSSSTGATAGGSSPAAATAGAGAGSSSSVSTPDLSDIGVVPVGGTGSAGSGSGSGSGSGGAGVTRPVAADRDSWHVDLRFGRDGTLTSKYDVPRLSPLPSDDDPFFVFLGVAADGKTAMFLVSSDADATGDGTCKPSKDSCDRVDLKAGESEFFDVTTPSGAVVQYELDLVSVSRKTSATAAMASAARSRESSAGRAVLRQAVETKQVDVSDLAYSRKLGLVIPSGQGDQNSALFGGFRVDLQFGSPGALVKRYNLARLTPLPSVEDPSLVYLGVLDDGKTALFLNPAEAAAAGDAVCEPSPTECQRVRLQKGQSATFAAPTINGSTSEYQLNIDDIAAVRSASPEEAAASRERESPAGRVILRRLITEVGSLVGDLTFAPDRGVVESGAAK